MTSGSTDRRRRGGPPGRLGGGHPVPAPVSSPCTRTAPLSGSSRAYGAPTAPAEVGADRDEVRRMMGRVVTVRYWAGARAAAGREQEAVDAATVGDLLAAIGARPRLARVLGASSLLVDGTAVRREDVGPPAARRGGRRRAAAVRRAAEPSRRSGRRACGQGQLTHSSVPSAKTCRFQIGSRCLTMSTSRAQAANASARCARAHRGDQRGVADPQLPDPVADRDRMHERVRRDLVQAGAEHVVRRRMPDVLQRHHRPAVVVVAHDPAEDHRGARPRHRPPRRGARPRTAARW